MKSRSGFMMGSVLEETRVYGCLCYHILQLWGSRKRKHFVMGLYVTSNNGWYQYENARQSRIKEHVTCGRRYDMDLMGCSFMLFVRGVSMLRQLCHHQRGDHYKGSIMLKASSCTMAMKTTMIYGTIPIGGVVEESVLRSSKDHKVVSGR